ncbi:hypothetical protein EON65_26625 [archaeon]|nr:MAG: hypothetical protein EON65_26625 [archaeon]
MAELDSLINSRMSLITQEDVRYDGILFSINQAESSIVLKDGKQSHIIPHRNPISMPSSSNSPILRHRRPRER